jgi:hypothetical protein
VCGASNSIAGFGTYSIGNRTSIGLNYQFKTYSSNHPALFNEIPESSKELFQRFEIKSQLRLSKRFQLVVSVPISSNKQERTMHSQTVVGFGDATLGLNYFLKNSYDSVQKRRFQWIVGGGIKIPTGKFQHPDSSDFMLYGGSGSIDFNLNNLIYFQKRNWTLVWESSVLIRTRNKYNYQAGNNLSSSFLVNRKLNQWGIYTGIQWNITGKDYMNRKLIEGSPTVGSILSNLWGITYQFKSFLIQGAYHIPIHQKLGNGYTHQKQAFTLSINYFFK